jgi:alkylation response protein AidB-like acyl-CoA dehydrogenase
MLDDLIHEPTGEERLIRESVADFVQREAAPDVLARLRHAGSWFDPRLHRAVADLGWLGILVPEAYGGVEMPLRQCAAAFEELGRAPLMGPLFTSGVLGSTVLLEGASEAQKAALLPAVASGSEIISLATADSSGGWWDAPGIAATLREVRGGFELDAVKPFVHDAEAATLLICAARLPASLGGGITLCLVQAHQPGVRVERPDGLPMGIGRVAFTGVRIEPDSLLASGGDGWTVLDRAALRALPILCAFMVGACRQIFEFTLEYTRQRSAFGQLIGRFQRVQDHVVELANQMDAATWITLELLARLEAGIATEADVHEAAAVAKEAYYQVCNYSHMVHAGPGTDLDHPLMGHTIASRALYQLLGTPDHHRRRMMDLRFPLPLAGG